MPIQRGDHRPECCRDPDNLYVAERKENADGVLIVRRCRECERRHFEAHAKPKTFGVTGS